MDIFTVWVYSEEKMIDLHTHSNASDGTFSPSALMENAKARGLTAVALTDHDTVSGFAEAEAAALRLGIRFIRGIEIGIQWEPGEFHLLGLGINNPGADFFAAVSELTELRERRNREMIVRMQRSGFNVSYENILAISGNSFIGRPHFAALLVNKGIVKSKEQAFDRYLGKGRPFYVHKDGLELRRAIDIIKNAGGIAVLAHPMSLYVAWGRLPDVIKGLKDDGLDGIEAWHPTAKVCACRRLEKLGRSLGLVITAGSDFHGESRPDRRLGITAGKIKIEEAILEAIPMLASANSL